MRTRSLTALCLAAAAPGCSQAADTTVSVAAASSLRDVLEQSAPAFEAAHPGLRLEFSFEASSTIARQLEAGAGFDVFLSADPVSVERVASRLDDETRRVFLSNRMALVSAAGRGEDVGSLEDLATASGRIAVAMPAVPAGRYARELLEGRGLLTELEPRFVQGRSARATLALVVSGAADFGLVYRSDQARAADVDLRWTAPAGEPPIAYVAAAVEDADPAARAFLDGLPDEAFQAAAEEQGFTRRQP